MKHGGFLFEFLLIMIFIGTTLQVSSQENMEIKRIRFKGNKTFSDKDLREQFNLKGASWVEKKVLKKRNELFANEAYIEGINELTIFYQSEGFMHVAFGETEYKLTRKKVVMTIWVHEGAPVIIGSVYAGNMTDFLVKKKSTRRLSATPGARFRDKEVKEDDELLTKLLTNKGYAYASTAYRITVDTTRNEAHIRWEANTGPMCVFGSTDLTPVARTPERITRKQIAFKEGDRFSPEKLTTTQQQIYDLGTFRVASVKAQLTHPPGDNIKVSITLNEAPATTTRVGVGYGKEDLFRAFVEFQRLNFPGGVRRMNFYVSHSAIEPYLIKTTLTQPAIWGPKSSVALTPYIHRQVEPGYKLTSYGSTLGWIQRMNKYTTGHINLMMNQVLLDTATVAQTNLDEIKKEYAKTGIEAGIIFDNATPRFDPTDGWSLNVNTQLNNIISGTKTTFLKHQAEVKYFVQAMPLVVLASRIKIGTIDMMNHSISAPVDDRFFSGGSRSVRGWARQQLGPVDIESVPVGGYSLLEGSVEPRIHIYGPLGVVTFLDWGNVWEQSGHFNFTQLRFAAGAGIRFATPIGPIGIDAARPVFENLQKWQFHFNIGHPF